MFSLYTIGNLLGFFLIMIICDVLAIIFANKVFAWPVFGIGAGLTLFSIIGRSRSLMAMLSPGYMTSLWVVYAILLFVGIFGIIIRRRRSYRY